MSINREKMLQLCKSLAERKIEAGCTEAEALEAAEKLAALMDKYGFDQADLEDTDQDREPIGKSGQTMPVRHFHKLNYVTQAVGEYADVRTWFTRNRENKTVTISIFGRQSDVVLAKYLLDIFRGAADRGWEEYYRTTRVSLREQRSYYAGMMTRISVRLREMKAARNAYTDTRGLTGKDLAVIRGSLVEAAFENYGIKLHKGRKSQAKLHQRSYQEGQKAGDQVHIGAGIGAEVRGKLPGK